MEDKPELSICIVSLQAKSYLEACINSIYEQTSLPFEVIVVDNGSTDGTLGMLKERFPQAATIRNNENLGFSLPSNQAMKKACGDYLLLLNPDTLVLDSALDRLVDYLKQHPEVGVCGPKVLNHDGTLQASCRRGESRPWAVFSHVSGLSRLFPNRPFFTEYHLSYLDEDETHPVAGVAGNCMLIRREVIEQIGYLDERFFAYQEDADYCFQARKAGWLVHYFPGARITHYGGQGGSKFQPTRSTIAWHHSYYLYYRKNLSRDYFFLFNWLFYGLMFVKLLLTLLRNSLSRQTFAGSRKPG